MPEIKFRLKIEKEVKKEKKERERAQKYLLIFRDKIYLKSII